jgi:hypothetical protein
MHMVYNCTCMKDIMNIIITCYSHIPKLLIGKVWVSLLFSLCFKYTKDDIIAKIRDSICRHGKTLIYNQCSCIFFAGQIVLATPCLLMSPILYFWEMSGFEPREHAANRCTTNLATHLRSQTNQGESVF